MRLLIEAIAIVLLLSACSATTPIQSSGAPDTQDAEPMQQSMPEPIQGRWGLVAADCEKDRSDAKGLLVIGPTQLRFYESVGTLVEIRAIDASRIRATFSFTGEGVTWAREEILDAQNNGQTLIRREYGDGAAPGPFEYRRCSR